MCIIIDTNSLSCVFDKESDNHNDFEPVLNWIYNGKGKVIYGGSKYLDEIKKKYLALFVQMRKAGKAIYINCDKVNEEEEVVNKMIKHPDYDDPHLVALLRISGCKLICSQDKRAYPYFRHSLFFSPSSKKPKIYSSKRNARLLTDTNIADVCLPCKVSSNIQKMTMGL